MIVVDSSVWIDYFNGVETRETALLNGVLGVEPVMIGDLILMEVLQGFRDDRDASKAREALDTLVFEPMVGRAIALASVRNYRALSRQGRHCPQNHRYVDRNLLYGEWAPAASL